MGAQIFESSGLYVNTAARPSGPVLQFTTPTAGGYAVLNLAEVEVLVRKLKAWTCLEREARGEALEDSSVEARVLRKVADAIRRAGEGEEFKAWDAAADLERMADEAK